MRQILAGLVVLTSLVSTAIADSTGPTSQPSDERLIAGLESAVQSVIERAAPSVVALRVDRRPLRTDELGDSTSPMTTATGSGIIIRGDGMILTCHHVIEGAATIQVTLHDGRRLRAKLVAQDPRDDLAIVRIALDGLPSLAMTDSVSPARGSFVVAIGYPFGAAFDGHASASFGIVSAVGRAMPEEFCRDEDRYFGDMIQATTPLQAGCSGGALVDRSGKLIGVLSIRGGDAGAASGFAIPINDHTRGLISRLLLGETIEYAYLGVDVAAPIEPAAAMRSRESNEGVRVVRVWDDGPARVAGLRPGDVIKSINGNAVDSPDQFVRLMGQFAPGRRVSVRLEQSGGDRTLVVRLGTRNMGKLNQTPHDEVELRGATLSRIDDAIPTAASLDSQAMMVVRVEADSAADRAGITPGDIIVGLEGRPIRANAEDWPTDPRRDLLVGLASGASVLVKAEEP